MQPRIIAATILLGTVLGAPASAEDAGIGAALFGQYCATCHGTSGQGDGPMADLITQTVPDLTQLTARNDGVYPMLKVIHIIDGRTGVRAHGGPMPTYGDVFMAAEGEHMTGDVSAVLETRGRILSLAMYLETIQN